MKRTYNNYQERVEAKKNKRLNLIIGMLSLVVLIGIGYAYFSSTLSNTNNEKLSTETATIALVFDEIGRASCRERV